MNGDSTATGDWNGGSGEIHAHNHLGVAMTLNGGCWTGDLGKLSVWKPGTRPDADRGGRAPVAGAQGACKPPVLDEDEIVRTDYRPPAELRFLGPVMPNAPKPANIVAARAYVDWLGLTIDELGDP
jgi:hypothetical protein